MGHEHVFRHFAGLHVVLIGNSMIKWSASRWDEIRSIEREKRVANCVINSS